MRCCAATTSPRGTTMFKVTYYSKQHGAWRDITAPRFETAEAAERYIEAELIVRQQWVNDTFRVEEATNA